MFSREMLIKAMKDRHSVRSYSERLIEGEVREKLQAFIENCNEESGLNIQLILNEKKAFGNFLAHYGMFSGVQNYIALVGKNNDELAEKCGYYGEKIVLAAQALGLNTCWAAATYKKVKTAYQVNDGEKLLMVIAVGYGTKPGRAHKNKLMEKLCQMDADAPKWFKDGMGAALMAPTAVNQQKFYFTRSGNAVTAKAGKGPCTETNLGIVKYHFELGAGKENFVWSD